MMSDLKGKSPAELTDQICRHRGHMILEAGAGTGKTYSLTERVIHQLMNRKVPLERMLALTFTDFAAAEMRSRIYEAVNRKLGEGDDGDTRDHLHKTRRQFSRNFISTFHAFCNRILQYFPDDITEISVPSQPRFGGEENFGQAESVSVEGSLELLSDYDEVLCMLEWKKSFYQLYKEHDGLKRQLTRLSVSDFESFMQRLSGVDESSLYEISAMSPDAYISKLERLVGEWRRESGELQQSLIETFASHPEWFKKPDDIPKSMADMEKNKIGTGFSKRLFDIPEMGMDRYEEICKQGLRLFGIHSELDKMDRYIKDPATVPGLSEYPGNESEAFDANHEAYWNMRNLAELALRWSALMRYKRFDAGYFNYDDMIWLTHELFEKNPEVVAQMRNRFDQILLDEFQDTDRRQWNIIRKLAFGNGNGRNGSGNGNRLGNQPENSDANGGKSRPSDKEILIVGDVKQAIYGFRGGDVAMMGNVHNDISKQVASAPDVPLKIIPLTYSFRSNKTIINFANRLFREVFSSREKATSYEAHFQPLAAPPDELSKNAAADGEIKVLHTDCKQLKKEHGELSIPSEALADNVMLLEARRIARFLREVYDGNHKTYQSVTKKMHDGDKAIGVLYKRRAHMYHLEQALKEVALPFSVAKGTQYYQRREVQDAWLLLSFLLDAYDDISLSGLLRSPMISLSDSGLLAIRVAMDTPEYDYPNYWSAVSGYPVWGDELLDKTDLFALQTGIPFLKKLREMVPGLRVSELLEYAFFTSGPYLGGSTGDSRVRENLVKLLDVVRSLEGSGRGTLFEVTEFLANRIREEAGDSEAEQPDPAPIQLMTIHGSKGLQFPMVVIPDMYAGQNDGGVQLYIADDDQDSFAFPSVAYKTGNREGEEEAEASFLYNVLKHEKQKREIAETKRLFYVAVTRAETHLLLSMAKPQRASEQGSFASFLNMWMQGGESGNTDNIRIEDLTAEELEQLAAIGPGAFSASGQAQKVSAQIPDRENSAYKKAVHAVSSEVITASGLHKGEEKSKNVLPETSQLPESPERSLNFADMQKTGPASRWMAIDPADAGTLIHRTLEFGMVTPDSVSQTDAECKREGFGRIPKDQMETFWERELMMMGYQDPVIIVEKNRTELFRHYRNADEGIRRLFGDGSQKRFEIAFEWSSRGTPGGKESDRGQLVTLRGSIDIIVRDREGREHIVDIKTGPVDGSTYDIAVIREHAREFGYDRQVRAYQQAYAAISGTTIPSSCVWLLFTWPDGGSAVPLSEL